MQFYYNSFNFVSFTEHLISVYSNYLLKFISNYQEPDEIYFQLMTCEEAQSWN